LRQGNTIEFNYYPCLIKSPTTGAQGLENQTKKQLQMHKSQCRNMKQQDNNSPSKVNSTTKDLNNSEEKEILNIEFQKQ
jgi:hypothetical protein